MSIFVGVNDKQTGVTTYLNKRKIVFFKVNGSVFTAQLVDDREFITTIENLKDMNELVAQLLK